MKFWAQFVRLYLAGYNILSTLMVPMFISPTNSSHDVLKHMARAGEVELVPLNSRIAEV